MEAVNETIQDSLVDQEERDYQEKLKKLELFLDSNPDRCRYQYKRNYTRKQWMDRFCGCQTKEGSKFCGICEGRVDKGLRLPPSDTWNCYIEYHEYLMIMK